MTTPTDCSHLLCFCLSQVPGEMKSKAPVDQSLHSPESHRILQQLADTAPVYTYRPVEELKDGTAIRSRLKFNGVKYSDLVSASNALPGSSSVSSMDERKANGDVARADIVLPLRPVRQRPPARRFEELSAAEQAAQAVQPAQVAAPKAEMTYDQARSKYNTALNQLKRWPKSKAAQRKHEQAKIDKMRAYHNDPEAQAKMKASAKARRDRNMKTAKAREELLARSRLQRQRFLESLGDIETQKEYKDWAHERSREKKKAKAGEAAL